MWEDVASQRNKAVTDGPAEVGPSLQTCCSALLQCPMASVLSEPPALSQRVMATASVTSATFNVTFPVVSVDSSTWQSHLGNPKCSSFYYTLIRMALWVLNCCSKGLIFNAKHSQHCRISCGQNWGKKKKTHTKMEVTVPRKVLTTFTIHTGGLVLLFLCTPTCLSVPFLLSPHAGGSEQHWLDGYICEVHGHEAMRCLPLFCL